MDRCNTRGRRYDKPFDEYRREARLSVAKLKPEIDANKEISWDRVLQVVEHDELIYKLTLKYLREDGYYIGNYKDPFIRKK